MTGNSAVKSVDVATLRQWLGGEGEIAFLDVREDGQHGAGHPLLAVNAPYSRLELVIGQLAPRRGCPVVLLDDSDGVAEKAARRLAALGYSAVHVLAGGVGAWSAAGHPLFPSTNVPSKAFAEIVEHEYGTPAISAAELERRRRAGNNIVVLDSRPLDEYARFHVPGAMTCPGAELVLRFGDLVPDPETTVVVSCAGRTPDEFAAGYLPGSISAPGGQLVQAIDRWVGVRAARLVLVDDTLARAVITAQWLQQMGWDVAVLDGPFDGASLATGTDMPEPPLPDVLRITAAEAAHWLDGGAAAVAVMASADYRRAHPEEAVWAIRPRLDRLPASVLQASRIVVFAENEAVGALAGADLAEIAGRPVALLDGGIAVWRAAGRSFAASPDDPTDKDRIDTIFWNHDRHAGNQEAMRAYLRWETELPGEIARDGLAGLRLQAS